MAQHAPVLQAELLGGEPGHPMHRVFQGKQAQITCIMAKDARKGAPEARMRVLVMRKTVRANHRVGIGEDALHIGLVHQEIDGATWDQLRRGVALSAAQFGGDI